MATPPFLKLSVSDQRAKFAELNMIEAERITEGLKHPEESEWSMVAATSRENSHRNRYTNVLPWDKSRVKLPVKEEKSDYINASYVCLDGETKYIACQGPLTRTSHHFWSMCFNESEKQANDIIIIAMITPVVEGDVVKCLKYWPDDECSSVDLSAGIAGDSIDIPDLTLEYVSKSYHKEGDFLLTKLELKSKDKTKMVYHFHYYKWADSKVPPSVTPLLLLSKEITALKSSIKNQPIPIVHCSAGVGRTGTFIALDHLFNENKVSSNLQDPILDTVSQLRSDRMMMVQTVYQFNFLYQSAKTIYKERANK